MTLDELIGETLAKCKQAASAAGLPAPEVTFRTDLRGRSRAGSAIGALRFLNFNPDYFGVQGAAYAQTIVHEYAHVVVYAAEREGRWHCPKPHGAEWKSVMVALGYEPHRTVQAPLARPPYARKVKRFEYRCTACGETFMLSAMKNLRHLMSETGYRHAEGHQPAPLEPVRRIET